VTHVTNTDAPNAPPDRDCCEPGETARLRYFHGRTLSALDLRREQAYHLDKARLHNRLLHGWGIVCGLEVEAVPKEHDDPCDGEGGAPVVIVGPGAAIDCHGREIVVRRPRRVAIETLLSEAELKELRAKPGTVYLTLCYREKPIEPQRPHLAAKCEPVADCEYGRVLETYRICATTTRPDPGPACEPCCGACGDECLELVQISGLDPDADLTQEQLHFGGRRPLALHDLAEISAINWVHGATYSREGATALLAKGLEVRFSRPVRVSSLLDGIVQVTQVEGGGGRAAGMYDIRGDIVDLPSKELTESLVFRSRSDETLQYGDRVLIRIHGDLILDECCRALDANHIGGAIPLVDDPPAKPVSEPKGTGCRPRWSGNGTEGGEFVSWIFVQERSGK
jgi:hypothetical protein